MAFETLITNLTIENLNSVNHSYLTIDCDTGQHSQFLRCFSHFCQNYHQNYHSYYHDIIFIIATIIIINKKLVILPLPLSYAILLRRVPTSQHVCCYHLQIHLGQNVYLPTIRRLSPAASARCSCCWCVGVLKTLPALPPQLLSSIVITSIYCSSNELL